MADAKTIYCPICGKFVAKYDGRSTMNVVARCFKCKKQVVYYLDTDTVVAKELPPRGSSSGVTFC